MVCCEIYCSVNQAAIIDRKLCHYTTQWIWQVQNSICMAMFRHPSDTLHTGPYSFMTDSDITSDALSRSNESHHSSNAKMQTTPIQSQQMISSPAEFVIFGEDLNTHWAALSNTEDYMSDVHRQCCGEIPIPNPIYLSEKRTHYRNWANCENG